MHSTIPNARGWLKGGVALSLLLNGGLVVLLFSEPTREPDDVQPATLFEMPLSRGNSTHRITKWSDVESSSPKELERKLRRIGCPKKFVRNVVVADIDREFHKRRLELVENRDEELGVRQLEFLELSNQRSAVIEATLGIDSASAPSKDWGGIRRSKVIAGMFSFLDPRQAEHA